MSPALVTRKRRLSLEAITGIVTAVALVALSVNLLLGWLLGATGYWAAGNNVFGGLFGISAYVYLARGGLKTMTEHHRAKEGHSRSPVAYVGFVTVTLFNLTWWANVIYATAEPADGQWELFRHIRYVLGVALLVLSLAYLGLRLLWHLRKAGDGRAK